MRRYSIDTYAVFGNPIGHSKSPFIHAEFARQTEQALDYIALLAPLENFPAAVAEFRAAGGRGANVTVPFKQEAYALCDHRSVRAELAGAVNTLWLDGDGGWYGDNTDGVGLVNDLSGNHKYTLKDRRVLILGAGGAVRGVLQPLLSQQPARLSLVNRTLVKAQELVELFGDSRLHACAYEDLPGQVFDLVINATSAGLNGQLPPLPERLLAAQGAVYDMMYGDTPTAFVRWGQNQQAALAVDGLGMLVEQAAEAFYLWRGIRPATAPVLSRLRREMAAEHAGA